MTFLEGFDWYAFGIGLAVGILAVDLWFRFLYYQEIKKITILGETLTKWREEEGLKK